MIKTIKKLTLITIVVVLVSCGTKQETPLSKLVEEKKELEKTLKETREKLVDIKAQIAELDSSQKIVLPIVTTAMVEEKPFSEYATFQGNVEADKNVMVSPEANGLIRSISVKEGEKVSQGQTIAILDAAILNKNLEELETALELAEYNFEKQKKLYDQKVGTEVQYIQAKNQKESLEKKIETLKTQAGKYVVRAPMSGYIDEIFPKVGEMASPGMPVVRLLDLNKVSIKADISENYLNTIKKGSKVTINFPSINKEIEDAKVSRTGKFLNPNNRTFTVDVDLLNVDNTILPNLIAEVKIEKRYNDKAIVIPSSSVLEDNKGQKYVFTVKEAVVKKRPLMVDFVSGNYTQVSPNSGLMPGEEVIVRGATAIVDGEKVDVRNDL